MNVVGVVHTLSGTVVLQLNFPPLKERELPLSPWLHSHGSLHKPLWQSFIPQLTCWKASEYPNDQSRPFV